MQSKSPFFIIEEFISPLQCEKLVSSLALKKPSRLENGDPIAYERYLPNDSESTRILESLADHQEVINSYYATSVASYSIKFQQFWENTKAPAQEISLPGWKYSRKKWTKVANVDFVGIVWLKDYNDSVPLDPRYETYGGKLEFPSFDFSFVPTRGTMTIFPATPNFAYAISHVLFGSMEQLVVGVSANKEFVYKSDNFPGSYREWF